MSLFSGIKYFLLNDKSRHRTLKEILGFYPKNKHLYEQAFTHKSLVNEIDLVERVSNERLEYLGDAILGAIMADYLFLKFPFEEEGFLTKVRSKLVSRNFLNQLSIDLGLDTFLETAKSTKRSKSIYGDAFEALIGAIYLDRGFGKCKKFLIDRVIKDYVDLDQLIKTETNFKSRLIEWIQSKKKNYEFDTFEDKGKIFTSKLWVNGKLSSEGTGSSKKRAEQMAAKLFLEEIKDAI